MAKEMEVQAASYVEVEAVAGAAIAGGEVITGTNYTGFSLVDVANGEPYSQIRYCENVKAAKAVGALTTDDLIYWDASANNVTKTATSNKYIGYVKKAAASADTHVNIVFDGMINFLKV